MISRLAILNYHAIQSVGDEYAVSLSAFEAQLEEIMAQGFSLLTLNELKEWRRGDQRKKPLLLTFDDGLQSHYDYAAPRLKKMDLAGIFFIPTDLVGTKGHMGWDEIRKLREQGFEIGSHGKRHIPLTDLSEEELREELSESKKVLEKKWGGPIRSFSVPRGFYQPRISKLAEEAGYEFVFTSQFDLNEREGNPLCLKRLAVRKNLSRGEFSQMIQGRLGAKRHWEALKSGVRSIFTPSLYDALASVKRKVINR